MNNFFIATTLILKRLAKNSVLLLLVLLTITHVIILAIYFENISNLPNLNNKHFAPHPVLSLLIHSSENLPAKDVKFLISSLTTHELITKHHRIVVSVDPQPKWNLRFNNGTDLQTVLSNLPPHTAPTYLSYQLDKNNWLNYSETTIEASYNIAILLVLIETALIALILFYYISLQRFRVPLQNFKESAERLGIDFNAAPIRVYGTKLVQETASAMNKMQTRLQDLINTRTKMLAVISHDLRTPITRLKLRAYLIEDETEAKKMIADLDEMEAMINSILIFAKDDFSKEKKIILDLNALLASICDDYADENRMIHATLLDERLPFLGNALMLKRAFNNLIQNAYKYCNEVWLTLSIIDEKIIIEIEDNGPGIPQQELDKVFQAYYRAKNTTTENTIGIGLGLTIAYEIMHAHQGVIKLKNCSSHSGLVVTITLPLNHDAPSAKNISPEINS